MQIFKSFLHDESGATAIEYALLAALIGLSIIGGATAIGSNLNTGMDAVGTTVGNSFTP